MYFSAGGQNSPLHRTFSGLLIAVLVHLAFDAATVYTVNHLDTVPVLLNDILHRVFLGPMVLIVYLFYRYIGILAETECGKRPPLDIPAKAFLALAELEVMLLPVHYAVTPAGNYSDGPHANVGYVSTAFYLLL